MLPIPNGPYGLCGRKATPEEEEEEWSGLYYGDWLVGPSNTSYLLCINLSVTSPEGCHFYGTPLLLAVHTPSSWRSPPCVLARKRERERACMRA